MQDYVKSIKLYFEEKRRMRFTGGIKMGFEDGTPQTFWTSTSPEFKAPGLEANFNLDAKLIMASSKGFSGALFFILKEGEITDFYCNETLQGHKLMEFLNRKTPVFRGSVMR